MEVDEQWRCRNVNGGHEQWTYRKGGPHSTQVERRNCREGGVRGCAKGKVIIRVKVKWGIMGIMKNVRVQEGKCRVQEEAT
ncbi:hypothetical protein DEO72_LG7g568 [Vigna unguiculata]|uniref:Uncharacterized protein n=1 Tax=Vigna unguiculata TaxID=3917 RepID=A0A4D6ME90_VIGUN|nr:hypothetical protein DEO72_LG7g568 [Vigna unguiculata]